MTLFFSQKSMLQKKPKITTGGFSFVEAIVYVSIMAMIMVVVINTLLRLTSAWGFIDAGRNLNEAVSFSLELMTREIRNAKSIAASGSTMDVSPGRLTVNTKDINNNDTTVLFSIQNGRLMVTRQGSPASYITPSGTAVSNLIFRQIDTPHSTAVRIEMTVAAFNKGATTTEEAFTSTAVLRGSYH